MPLACSSRKWPSMEHACFERCVLLIPNLQKNKHSVRDPVALRFGEGDPVMWIHHSFRDWFGQWKCKLPYSTVSKKKRKCKFSSSWECSIKSYAGGFVLRFVHLWVVGWVATKILSVASGVLIEKNNTNYLIYFVFATKILWRHLIEIQVYSHSSENYSHP
jgi:hypothetical protein